MFKKVLKRLINRAGYGVQRLQESGPAFNDVDPKDQMIWESVKDYTMAGRERTLALISSVRYILSHDVPGDFVECGVWRGGSAMAIAMVLAQEGRTDRRLWLFDTFTGMTSPTRQDVETASGIPAREILEQTPMRDGRNVWCIASLEEVVSNMEATGFPLHQVEIVKGDVCVTLREGRTPNQIALLRLDTDWYESTKIELEVLYPRLEVGGICLLDDYGHWSGARLAADGYFAGHLPSPLLVRIDYTGRLILKTSVAESGHPGIDLEGRYEQA